MKAYKNNRQNSDRKTNLVVDGVVLRGLVFRLENLIASTGSVQPMMTIFGSTFQLGVAGVSLVLSSPQQSH